MKRFVLIIAAAAAMALAPAARAEDGYDLWLRYQPVEASAAGPYRAVARELVIQGGSPTLAVARAELERGLSGLLGAAPSISSDVNADGAIVLGTPATSHIVAALNLPLERLGPDGYLIRSVTTGGRRATVVAGNSDVGVLYGVFDLLRRIQTRQGLEQLDVIEAPKVKLRLLNHWDNLDRSVERGYSGQSIWDWWKLPDAKDPRYIDYARANASLGINGAVLNNVNAKADSLTAPYIAKAAAVADVLRPYGVKVYLSARFSAPWRSAGSRPPTRSIRPCAHSGPPRRTKSIGRSPTSEASW